MSRVRFCQLFTTHQNSIHPKTYRKAFILFNHLQYSFSRLNETRISHGQRQKTWWSTGFLSLSFHWRSLWVHRRCLLFLSPVIRSLHSPLHNIIIEYLHHSHLKTDVFCILQFVWLLSQIDSWFHRDAIEEMQRIKSVRNFAANETNCRVRKNFLKRSKEDFNIRSKENKVRYQTFYVE